MDIDPNRVKEIFLEAAEQPDEAARAAYLDRACGGDAGLRERVEALLRSHDPAGSFLGKPAAGAPDSGQAGTMAFDSSDSGDGPADPNRDDSDDLPFLTPSSRPDSLGRLGHYEMLQVLGKGGFGIVFRAFDETLQRVVAVKVMAPQIATLSPARKRFLREARSSAQVRHENVVQVYEVGEQPLPFLAMEFIPGETLQQKLDRSGPLEVSEVLRIGRQIAEGLAAAHVCDLIHRDIKPANILLEGGSQKVKITDFGLARAADDASISQSGIIAGTPMFMAPEQALGHKIDQRADLFSLGSVLYQMVSGRPPFRAPSALAVLKRVAEEPPRPIPEIIPETPAWLCGIIAKLHAKNPDERYQSARETADVLADCEAQLKAHARVKDFSRIPRGKPRRSGRWKWAAAAAVLVVIGVSLIWQRGWVNEFFGARPPSATGTTAGPGASRKVAWGDVVDPLGDCRFVEEDGRLTIEAPGGPKRHDLNSQPDRNNLTAPRVLREVEGDFEARVTVSDWTPGGPLTSRTGPPYVAAGLVVWQDESHFLRHCRVRRDVPPDPTYTEVNLFWGAGESHSKGLTSLFGTAHLRVRRVNGVLFVAQSSNGLNWIDEAAAPDFSYTGPVRVGVVAISTVFQDFTPEFEGFEVNGLPPSLGLPNAPLLFVARFTDADVRRIAALPAAQQVEEVRKELMRHNPDFDGKLEYKIEDGVVTELRINTQQVTDISPIRVFDSLRVLTCQGGAPLADPMPLKGMNLAGLTELNLSYTQVGDAGLAPFKDCKHLTSLDLIYAQVTDAGLANFKDCKDLTLLQLGGTGVTDAGLANFKDCKNLTNLALGLTEVTDAGLANFKDCKNLTDLGLGLTQVTDAGLAYFEDCKNLTHLDLFGAKVSDVGLAHFKDCKNLTSLRIDQTQIDDAGLAHFKGMLLLALWIDDTGVTDLTPLQGMPLEEIHLTPKNITRGLGLLRDMKGLKRIGVKENQAWPAAEFWERYDKGEFKE